MTDASIGGAPSRGHAFSSVQEQGRGRFERLLCERFGPLNFGMALVLEAGRMRLVVRRWSVFGIPLPLALAPRGNAYEFAQDGRFHFHVEIGHPFTGLIVGYRGWLVRVVTSARSVRLRIRPLLECRFASAIALPHVRNFGFGHSSRVNARLRHCGRCHRFTCAHAGTQRPDESQSSARRICK